MVVLEDIYKRRTQEIFGKKRAIEEKIERKRQEIRGKEQERRQISTDISKKRDEARESKGKKINILAELEKLQEQLEDLERRRTEILNSIIEYKERQEEIEDENKSQEERIRELEEEIRKITNEISRIEHELAGLENQRSGYEEEICEEAKNSFREYCDQVEKYLTRVMETLPEVENAKDAYKALMKAKDEDSRVRKIWEAREEWRNIFEISQVETVKETAKIEIDKLEEKIEEEFPGALLVERIEDNERVVSALYYHKEIDGPYRIFLPITRETWNSIEEGLTRKNEELAARVFWGFSCVEDGGYDLYYGFPTLCTDEPPESLTLSLEFPNMKIVEFALIEIPRDIFEAIAYEQEL